MQYVTHDGLHVEVKAELYIDIVSCWANMIYWYLREGGGAWFVMLVSDMLVCFFDVPRFLF